MDIGRWEGKTYQEVRDLHGDLLDAIRAGEDLAFGEVGETLRGFRDRVLGALGALADRVGEGDVLVVTHGGVIDVVVGSLLGRRPGRRTVSLVQNTSLTVLEGSVGELRLSRFNDATHLDLPEDPRSLVAFVRHGVTSANKELRIQGQSCWGLDEEGRLQAAALAAWYGPVARVVSSPLPRALETASAFGGPIEVDDDLKEMGFGDWEGLTFEDLREDPLARRIYHDGEDLPRGGSGESFGELVERLGRFLDRFRPDPRTVVVSHGAAIRAVVSVVAGNPEAWRRLATPPNTSISHLAWDDEGPTLVDYGLVPHLEP
jgi:probable phosphoglycerate mutase